MGISSVERKKRRDFKYNPPPRSANRKNALLCDSGGGGGGSGAGGGGGGGGVGSVVIMRSAHIAPATRRGRLCMSEWVGGCKVR